MKKNKKFKYYNTFLVLSLVLIAGYFAISLFFLNKVRNSGKQAENFGYTIEKTNAIIQHTYQLENAAYNFFINKNSVTSTIYNRTKDTLLDNVQNLSTHCHKLHFAHNETSTLQALMLQRINMLEKLVHSDTLSAPTQLQQIEKGRVITAKIVATLKTIRQENNLLRATKQKAVESANFNTMVIVTLFGGGMIIIVFFSFFRMREEILRSNRYLSEIEVMNKELSTANEHLENFAYVASHDLSEPLRKIEVFGEMLRDELQEKKDDTGQALDYVERMQKSARRMQKLIHDILTLSRISKAKDLQQNVHPATILANVLNDLTIAVNECNAKIEVQSLPPVVKANETQLHQLFQNLISNAIKFRKENEPPLITISSELMQGNELSYQIENQAIDTLFWKISITDNGIGFDEKYIDKIFTIFQRLEGRSSCEGTGIGLSVCKKICEANGGFITAKSKEGEGATFIVYLPKIDTI